MVEKQRRDHVLNATIPSGAEVRRVMGDGRVVLLPILAVFREF